MYELNNNKVEPQSFEFITEYDDEEKKCPFTSISVGMNSTDRVVARAGSDSDDIYIRTSIRGKYKHGVSMSTRQAKEFVLALDACI